MFLPLDTFDHALKHIFFQGAEAHSHLIIRHRRCRLRLLLLIMVKTGACGVPLIYLKRA